MIFTSVYAHFSVHICLHICECTYVHKHECAYFLRPRTGAHGCLTSVIFQGLSISASKSQDLLAWSWTSPAVPLRPCFHCPAYSSSIGLCNWSPEVCYFICKWPFKEFNELFPRRENPLWCFKRVDVSSSHQAIRWGCGFLQLSGRQQIIRQGKMCALFLQQCVKTAAGLSRASDSQQEGPSSVVPFLPCINYRSTWLQSPNMKETPQVSYQFL